jgi:hypothetical protein
MGFAMRDHERAAHLVLMKTSQTTSDKPQTSLGFDGQRRLVSANAPAGKCIHFTPLVGQWCYQCPPGVVDREALSHFRSWVASLDQDTLDHVYGVDSVEDTLRLLRGFETHLARVGSSR